MGVTTSKGRIADFRGHGPETVGGGGHKFSDTERRPDTIHEHDHVIVSPSGKSDALRPNTVESVPTNDTGQYATPSGPTEKVKVYVADGITKTPFRIKKTSQLQKLMGIYCKQKCLDEFDVCFTYQGKELPSTSTPCDLDLPDSCTILCMPNTSELQQNFEPHAHLVISTPGQCPSPTQYSSSNARFEAELRQLQKFESELKQKLNMEEIKSKKLQSDVTLLQAKLAKAEKMAVESMIAPAMTDNELQKLRNQLEAMNEEKEDFSSNAAQLAETQAKLLTLNAETIALKASLSDANDIIFSLKNEVGALREKLAGTENRSTAAHGKIDNTFVTKEETIEFSRAVSGGEHDHSTSSLEKRRSTAEDSDKKSENIQISRAVGLTEQNENEHIYELREQLEGACNTLKHAEEELRMTYEVHANEMATNSCHIESIIIRVARLQSLFCEWGEIPPGPNEAGSDAPQETEQVQRSSLMGREKTLGRREQKYRPYEDMSLDAYGKLLLVLKVELGGGKTGTIKVRKGQNVRQLVLHFCAEHALDTGKVADALEKHLQSKLKELGSLADDVEMLRLDEEQCVRKASESQGLRQVVEEISDLQIDLKSLHEYSMQSLHEYTRIQSQGALGSRVKMNFESGLKLDELLLDLQESQDRARLSFEEAQNLKRELFWGLQNMIQDREVNAAGGSRPTTHSSSTSTRHNHQESSENIEVDAEQSRHSSPDTQKVALGKPDANSTPLNLHNNMAASPPPYDEDFDCVEGFTPLQDPPQRDEGSKLNMWDISQMKVLGTRISNTFKKEYAAVTQSVTPEVVHYTKISPNEIQSCITFLRSSNMKASKKQKQPMTF